MRPETAALRTIQTIHVAELYFNSQHGRYACSMDEMDLPAVQHGYKFSLTCNTGGYILHAVPEIYGRTSANLYSDQTMIIRANYGPEPATVTSKEVR